MNNEPSCYQVFAVEVRTSTAGKLLNEFKKEKKLENTTHSNNNENEEIQKVTKKEMEILILVANGSTNNDIAKKLFISLDTVKKHLYFSYKKLGVKNRVAAIIKAKELGLIKTEK